MARRPFALVACLAASVGMAAPAGAQVPPRRTLVRLHATVAAVSADGMTVRTASGEILPVALPPGLQVSAAVARSLSDIKPGAYVGSAAVRGRDGELRAVEIYILQDSPRGAGAGRGPTDQPDQLTNDTTVDGVADGVAGGILRLRHSGGWQSTIEVEPDARVVRLVPGDRSLLVPGAVVAMRAVRSAGGALTAVSVQAEVSGPKPLP